MLNRALFNLTRNAAGDSSKYSLLKTASLARHSASSTGKSAAPSSGKSGGSSPKKPPSSSSGKSAGGGKDDKNKKGGSEKLEGPLKMPAFPLKNTMDLFLKTCEPGLSECMDEVEKDVKKFMKKDGPALQKLLEQTAASEENWLATRWLSTAYLRYRDPVVVYSSPGQTFPRMSPFKNQKAFLKHAANITAALVDYKEFICAGKLPVQKMGKYRLDNSTYEKIFGTCRIPAKCEDKLEYNMDSKHCVVAYQNHFFKLAVYDKDCKQLHPDLIEEQLNGIVNYVKTARAADPIGLLTAGNRDDWAEAYEKLMSNSLNCESVKVIQKALFLICLDECVPASCGNEDNVHAYQMTHGGGSTKNSANRWFDKTIQLVINPNGMTGFCYEHSPAEGQAIVSMIDWCKAYLAKKSQPIENEDYYCFRKLDFDLSPCVELYIYTAAHAVDKIVADLEYKVVFYDRYGADYIKCQKMSPDSFIQMALQLAYYKLHGRPAAQYETAHLRMYIGGRTETIRSLSCESLAFVKGMMSYSIDTKGKVELLRAAVKAHREYVTRALQGKGVDRHLLGLKLMALEDGRKVPEFFSSVGYLKSANFDIGTSQVNTKEKAFMCYAPMIPDGYACCYNPRKDDIILSTSSWRTSEKTNTSHFAESIRDAFNMMLGVLTQFDQDKEDEKRTGKKDTPKSKL